MGRPSSLVCLLCLTDPAPTKYVGSLSVSLLTGYEAAPRRFVQIFLPVWAGQGEAIEPTAPCNPGETRALSAS